MKRTLFALTLLVCSTAEAQRLDPTAPLADYAAKLLPKCAGGRVSLAPLPPGPANFASYVVKLESDDKYCSTRRTLLYSSKSNQILIGSLIMLQDDDRPAEVRIRTTAAEALRAQVSAKISPAPLPDGLRRVTITRETPYGPFAYHGFVDASEKYLFVGRRGVLGSDPSKALRDSLGVASAARRGNQKAAVEIIELSDFQCPTCASAHKLLEPLIRKNLSNINYVRIDLPLFEMHKWAVQAAMGARAIQRVAPAKYWEYVDYVFENQEQIGSRSFDDVLKEYVADHDIDWPAVQKIYASKAERQALLDQVSRAFAAGVASTPTFIINGQLMGFGDGTFTVDAIKSALAAAKAKPAK